MCICVCACTPEEKTHRKEFPMYYSRIHAFKYPFYPGLLSTPTQTHENLRKVCRYSYATSCMWTSEVRGQRSEHNIQEMILSCYIVKSSELNLGSKVCVQVALSTQISFWVPLVTMTVCVYMPVCFVVFGHHYWHIIWSHPIVCFENFPFSYSDL